MKLQFKRQRFQSDAAKAVVDVFAGQPYLTPFYQTEFTEDDDFTGWSNADIVPELTDSVILEHLNQIQRSHQIAPSDKLEGKFNLTIEMETGVGKTYTYIKTIYELNKQYGWSRYLIVVPGIAIREGVYKAFQVTQEHFAEEYGKKIRFFIFNSSHLTEIDRFASDCSINVMIINSQAFHAKSRDARRIYMKLDEFHGRRPVDILAKTHPILIIDEPQSVEGKQTKENLRAFHPLMTLRYSATHKSDSIYNMVYRLDAIDAYQQQLVKRIAVKGITESGTTATDSYVYLESIHLSKAAPTAAIQFDVRGDSGIERKSRKAGVGFDLYAASGGLPEYKDGFVVKRIDGRDDSVEFVNGIKLYAGDVLGKVNEEQIRRIQIRETILSHIERERQLFARGIKVLSLFFIDEVAHYRQYDSAGQSENGIYAQMFEEEYQDIIGHLQYRTGEGDYMKYLAQLSASGTHAGYFSMDKHGHIVNRIAGDDRKNKTSNDMDAYDLIMKNKELLLDPDPKRSPVRFLFSHSALREGWDNPNVFQICTLKQSGSEVRKRQEVGRGLRLCVDRQGQRMDASVLGAEVHQVNVLTIIASESYESFAKGLQAEIAQAVADRPRKAGDRTLMAPENARGSQIELQADQEKLNSKEFQALWSGINTRSVYAADYNTEEMIQKVIATLNKRLRVSKICFKVESGQMKEIQSGKELLAGASMVRISTASQGADTMSCVNHGVRYDLAGKIVDETGLTRKDVIRILTGMEQRIFDQFRENPEEFISRAAALIDEQKAAAMIGHITYRALDHTYDTDIFTKAVIRGRPGVNAIRTNKHLFDYVVYDSVREKVFAEKLDAADEVAVYVKLPHEFCISTPAGNYTPDWAIAFHQGTVKQMYWIVEIKGNMDFMQLCPAEKSKIHCAGAHFQAISNGNVGYAVADSYESFMEKAMRQENGTGTVNL